MDSNEKASKIGGAFAPAEPLMAVFHDGHNIQVTPVVGFATYLYEDTQTIGVDAIIEEPGLPGYFVDTDSLKSYPGFGGIVPKSAVPEDVMKGYREALWSNAAHLVMEKIEGTRHPSLTRLSRAEDHKAHEDIGKLRDELARLEGSAGALQILKELETTIAGLYAEVFDGPS